MILLIWSIVVASTNSIWEPHLYPLYLYEITQTLKKIHIFNTFKSPQQNCDIKQ